LCLLFDVRLSHLINITYNGIRKYAGRALCIAHGNAFYPRDAMLSL